jgi:replicative DNA helicase
MADWLPERLPEDVDAERSLIATLCAPGAEMAAEEFLPILSLDDFIDPRHRAVLKAAKLLLENGAEINPLTLKDVVDSAGDLGRLGGYPGLVEMLGAEEVQHPQNLVDILKRKAKLRLMIRTGAAMVRAAVEESDDPDSLLAGYVEDLTGEIGDSKKLKVSSYMDAREKAMRGQALLRKEHIENVIRIGIPTIDQFIVARPGSLGVIAGKSSVGKSALAIQLQVHTPNSLLLSFEMGDEEVEARLLSHHTGLSAEGFLRGTHPPMDIPEEIFKVSHKITDFKTREFRGILAMVKSCVRKLGIRAVIVDYFQLMDPPDIKNAAVAYRLSKMSGDFKTMAKQLGVAVALLSQFNREVADGERPKLENLKETGGLGDDANWVLMCWTERPDYQPDEDRIVFMELAKNRGGRRWVKARTLFMPEKTRFTEQQQETDRVLIPTDSIRSKKKNHV